MAAQNCMNFRKNSIRALTPPSFSENYVSIFRCASISWIHVGESVSHSVIHVFEILSNLGHLIRVLSECVQSVFRVCSECVQNVFRVCSECVQSVFRVCSILKSFHHQTHLVCQFLAFFYNGYGWIYVRRNESQIVWYACTWFPEIETILRGGGRVKFQFDFKKPGVKFPKSAK